MKRSALLYTAVLAVFSGSTCLGAFDGVGGTIAVFARTFPALMTVSLNLGAFLCSSWDSLIGRITGDTLYMPLYIGAAIFAVLSVVLLIKRPRMTASD